MLCIEIGPINKEKYLRINKDLGVTVISTAVNKVATKNHALIPN